jgi:hypothetical protein
MGKEEEKSLSSFICYNCNEKNYFDKEKYTGKNEREMSLEAKIAGHKVEEVTIECKSCREINDVIIEY